jgi:hypothetical protein
MTKIPGRVAFRVEGNLWVAYWAMPDTMEGAVFLASIAFGAVSGPKNSDMKHRFMNMARDIAAAGLPEGVTINGWNEPIPAPEHEKAGRA